MEEIGVLLPYARLALPDKRFTTILMDPPWNTPGGGRLGINAIRRNPDTRFAWMSLECIKDLPIAELATPRAHLYMWVVNIFIHQAYHLIEDWGFRNITPLIWVKRRKPGSPLQMGMGVNWRITKEICLWANRGSLPTLTNNTVDLLEAPRPLRNGRSSLGRKPPEMYDLIERQSPAPYLELFARTTRAGWESWGNEVGKFDKQ